MGLCEVLASVVLFGIDPDGFRVQSPRVLVSSPLRGSFSRNCHLIPFELDNVIAEFGHILGCGPALHELLDGTFLLWLPGL